MTELHFRQLVAAIVGAVMGLTCGCGSLVGADCRAPLSQCGRGCVDLSSDNANCGACANACSGGRACVSGLCSISIDAGRPDAGLDAALDASARDGGGDGATLDEAGAVDANALDADAYVDLDAAADGGNAADANVDGGIPPGCAPLTDCGGSCTDLSTDPDHCGSCAVSCSSGICIGGSCESALAGHLVVIGHDFETRRSAMSVLLANAVLLPGRASVRVLVWEGDASQAALAGTYAAIAEGAGSRAYVTRVASGPAAVLTSLATSDTFVIVAQANASDAELTTLGSSWGTALTAFIANGGVVVLLDTPSSINAGTYQVLASGGLFSATATGELVLPRLTTVAGRAGDPVLIGVPLSYRGESHTMFYSTSDPDSVVTSTSGPVVFDRTVTP